MTRRRGLAAVLAARDPARARLVVAGAVSVGILASAALTELLVRRLGLDEGLLSVAVILSLQAGNMIRDRSAGARLATTALLIPTAVFAVALAVFLSPHRVVVTVGFVAASGAAVWARRFGARAGAVGGIAFMGYFFALFMKPSVSELPAFCLVAAVAVTSQTAVRALLLLARPRRELVLLLREFRAASDAAVLTASRTAHVALLRADLARIDSVSRAVDAWRQRFRLDRHVADGASDFDDRMLDARVDTEEACYELEALRGRACELPPSLRRPVARLRRVLEPSASPEAVAASVTWATGVVSGSSSGEPVHAASELTEYLVARATLAHARLRAVRPVGRRRATSAPSGSERTTAERPTVGIGAPRVGHAITGAGTPARAGTDGGSASTGSRRRRWVAWSRWAPTSRMAVQVMIAAALAAAIGEVISASRWYWAVLTAFVIFMGTSTRGAILTRALRRVIGTLFGIMAGVPLVVAAGGNTDALLAVCVLGVFGMLYFGPLNYLYSASFMTVMLVALYGLLGILDGGVLAHRLEETVAGGVIGVLCAYLIMSSGSATQLLGKVNAYFDALGGVLRIPSGAPDVRDVRTGPRQRLRTLEIAQAELEGTMAGMSSALRVTDPQERTTGVHLMYVSTRSAARFVQVGSDCACVHTVAGAVSAVAATAEEARRALCDPAAVSASGGAPTPRRAFQHREGHTPDPRSAEGELLTCLTRLEWALRRIIELRENERSRRLPARRR